MADDGSVTEANKVKWSTVKTKIGDPVKTLSDDINTDLVEVFDRGPVAVTSNTTLAAGHNNKIVQVSGSGVTLNLSDASTLGSGWYTDIVNTDTTNTVTIGRATASNTVNETTADVSLLPLQQIRAIVNAAANGFLVDRTIRQGKAYAGPVTISGVFTANIPVPTNLSIAPSVGSNALTIAIKGNDGNDASATNPIRVDFRSATLTSGVRVWRDITAALSAVVSSGSTLGHVSAIAQFVYVYLIDNAGTPEIAYSGSAMWDQGGVVSTTAEGGAGAADSAVALYSTTARSNVACRLIGRLKSTQATAGTWATAIAEVTNYPFQDNHVRSTIRLANGNGHGSTSVCWRRWTNTIESVGTDMTYADSATAGMSVTVNFDGLYTVSYTDLRSGAGTLIGVTRNSVQGTVSIANVGTITSSTVLCFAENATGFHAHCGGTFLLKAGDIIRAHTDGNVDGTSLLTRFTITRVG